MWTRTRTRLLEAKVKEEIPDVKVFIDTTSNQGLHQTQGQGEGQRDEHGGPASPPSPVILKYERNEHEPTIKIEPEDTEHLENVDRDLHLPQIQVQDSTLSLSSSKSVHKSKSMGNALALVPVVVLQRVRLSLHHLLQLRKYSRQSQSRNPQRQRQRQRQLRVGFLETKKRKGRNTRRETRKTNKFKLLCQTQSPLKEQGQGQGQQINSEGLQTKNQFQCVEIQGSSFPQTKKQKNTKNVAKNKCWCKECGKCFSSPGNLEMHIKIHCAVKPFVCTIQSCGKGFNQRNLLSNHKRNYHLEKSCFSCTYCGKGFKEKKLHKKHMLANHNHPHPGGKGPGQVELFQCRNPTCIKTFSSREETEEHFSTHGDVTCQICDKVFGISTELKRHMRNIHKLM